MEKDVETNAVLVDSNGNVIPLESLLTSQLNNLIAMNADLTDLIALIGGFGDLVGAPYVLGVNSILAHLNTAYFHIHGTPFTYPRLANSVQLQSGAGVWNNTGVIVEIIPALAMAANFDLHWANISSISANGEGLIEFFSGAVGEEEWIGETGFFRNAVQSQEGAKKIIVSQRPAGTRISARISDNTAGQITANIKFDGHYYV